MVPSLPSLAEVLPAGCDMLYNSRSSHSDLRLVYLMLWRTLALPLVAPARQLPSKLHCFC